MTRPESLYSKSHPFLASVKERYALSKAQSKKSTQHVVLNLESSGIHYEVGDSIGVLPTYDPELVERTLLAMKADGTEVIVDKNGESSLVLREYLTKKANISEVSRKLISEILQRQTHPQKRERLQDLFQEGNKEKLKQFLAYHELWKILSENEEVTFNPQELCHMLMPLLPRLYSIASSQKVVGDEVHLTVALVEHLDASGYVRRGVCTHYLCKLVNPHASVIPVYIQPHHGFTLPADHHCPIVMIGPGTGIAPFRAFMQERIASGAQGKNWLFFGEWTRANEFFYENEWKSLESQGKLRMDLAFSRDQVHKVYVQHKMMERAKELFNWIQEGAIIYVCGDAHRMAKDVEAALLLIIQEQGKMDELQAKVYLKQMRGEKRYLKDVY